MKTTIRTIAALIVLSGIGMSGDISKLENGITTEKAGFIARHKAERNETILTKACEDLSSKNPLTADLAMDQLIELKDKQMLAVALSYPSASIQTRAAHSLRTIGDKSTVPELTRVLEKSNKSIMKGGSDTIAWNRDLKSELIATIAKLSGVEYDGSSDYSVREVKEFIGKLKRAGFAPKQEKESAPSK